MYEYPFGNGQQLNLDWFLAEWKNLLTAWEAEKNGIEGALQAEIDRAEAALADVFAARDAAAQSAANALESKNAAAQSATDASGYLATVRADANTASDAARNAANSAQTALASKNNAADSASAATQSAQNANASKNAAAQSASDADASKSAAAQSAADALANKNAAAQSASDAEDAAASVEASAQQIATNASDINNLKESLNLLNGWKQKNTNMPNGFFSIGAQSFNDAKASELEIFAIIPAKEYPNTNFSVDPSGYDENGAVLYQGGGISAGSRLVDFKSENLILHIIVYLAGNIVNTVTYIQSATNRSKNLTFSMFSSFAANAIGIRAATVYLNNNSPFDEEFPVFYKFNSGNYI